MRISLPKLLSDVLADAKSIDLDRPGGGYDKVYELLERQGKLPQGRADRKAIIAAALLASRWAQQRFGGALGPVANFFTEVGQDCVREQAKRILERAPRTITINRPRRGPGMFDRLASGIFPWLKDK